jgi:hypothetical protein
VTERAGISVHRRASRALARAIAAALAAALLAPGQAAAAPLTEAAPVELEQQNPGVGGFVSDNVSYVGTIPLDSPGVGGRVLKVGKQVRFYVTGLKGLTIYDVTDPALPIPLGTFPFPHAQNEDVDVSDDGKRVIISADGSLLIPIMPATRGIHVIDTSDPLQPTLLGSINEGNHTSTCADAKCEWLYSSNGSIYDARKPEAIKNVGRWKPVEGGAHDLNRDATGLIVSDSSPRYVLNPRKNPAHPKVIASGMPDEKIEPRYQHNNLRPRAAQWKPRKKGAPGYNDPKMRPGELLISNSETNITPNCGDHGGGGLSTFSMANFDKGAPLKQLDAFSPMNGDYNSSGDPAINALGCSGHWFTERNNIIAAGWYEHGVRFVKVNPTNGKLNQVGFFQPVVTEASAAYWVGGKAGEEYVYTVDYARGIDILKFDRKAEVPTRSEFDASWLANLDKVGALSERERYICGIAQQQ